MSENGLRFLTRIEKENEKPERRKRVPVSWFMRLSLGLKPTFKATFFWGGVKADFPERQKHNRVAMAMKPRALPEKSSAANRMEAKGQLVTPQTIPVAI